MASAFSQVLDLPLVEAADFPQSTVAPELFSPRLLKDAGVLPLRDNEAGLTVTVADPADAFVPDALTMATGKGVACTSVYRRRSSWP